MEDSWNDAQRHSSDSPTAAASSATTAHTTATTTTAAARVGGCTRHDGHWTTSAGWAAVRESTDGDAGPSAKVAEYTAAAATAGSGGTAEHVDDGWWWRSASARNGYGEGAYADSDANAGNEGQGCTEEGCPGRKEDGGTTAVALDFHNFMYSSWGYVVFLLYLYIYVPVMTVSYVLLPIEHIEGFAQQT